MRELEMEDGTVLVAPSGAEYSVVKVRQDFFESIKEEEAYDVLVFFLYSNPLDKMPTRLEIPCDDDIDFYDDEELWQILDENSYEVMRYYTFSYTLQAPSREEAENDFYEAMSDANRTRLGVVNMFNLTIGENNVTK